MLSSRLLSVYGGVVIGLTIDEDGIPATADGKESVWQEKIIEEAKENTALTKKRHRDRCAGNDDQSEPEGAKVTLEALKKVREIMVSVRFLVYRTFRSVFRTVRQLIQISIRWPCRMD